MRCSSVDPAPHYVLRIWRGGALLVVEMLEDRSHIFRTMFHCEAWLSDIEGVALVPGESLRIDVVALPSVGQDFVPTLMYSAFIASHGVDDQIALVRRRVEQEEPDDRFMGRYIQKVQLLPRTSSPLFESDNATCFNQTGATLLAMGGHDNSDWYPNCYAHIVRDTNGEMTELNVNQLWWNFPAPCLQSIMLNRRD